MSGNFRKKKIALAGALMFVVTSVSAQTVKGVVTDNTGEPIIGASVMEVGVAGNGGVTDIDGNFTVNLKGKSKKLKISYIGMKAKEVSVAGKETIDVKLEDDNTSLTACPKEFSARQVCGSALSIKSRLPTFLYLT